MPAVGNLSFLGGGWGPKIKKSSMHSQELVTQMEITSGGGGGGGGGGGKRGPDNVFSSSLTGVTALWSFRKTHLI